MYGDARRYRDAMHENILYRSSSGNEVFNAGKVSFTELQISDTSDGSITWKHSPSRFRYVSIPPIGEEPPPIRARASADVAVTRAVGKPADVCVSTKRADTECWSIATSSSENQNTVERGVSHNAAGARTPLRQTRTAIPDDVLTSLTTSSNPWLL